MIAPKKLDTRDCIKMTAAAPVLENRDIQGVKGCVLQRAFMSEKCSWVEEINSKKNCAIQGGAQIGTTSDITVLTVKGERNGIIATHPNQRKRMYNGNMHYFHHQGNQKRRQLHRM